MEKNAYLALCLFGLLLAGISSPLRAQAIAADLDSLQAVNDLDSQAIVTAKVLLRYLPGPPPTNGRALLAAYADNPYLDVIVEGQDLRNRIAVLELDTLVAAIRMENERTGRDRYNLIYDRADLFNDDRVFDVRWLAKEFAKPDPKAIELVEQKAKLAQASVSSSTDYVSVLAAGLSDWIQRRAQREFTVTFMARLQDRILEKELQRLFPATARLLENVDVADYRAFLPDARVAFAEDLQAITFNFADFLRASGAVDPGDPRLLNFLLVYELVDLSARGLDLPEVLGYARGELDQRRLAAEQSINLSLSTNLARTEAPTTANLLDAYNDAVLAFRNVGTELKDEAQSLAIAVRELRSNPAIPSRADSILQAFLRSDLVTRSSYQSMFDREGRHFGEASYLLKGQPPYQYWKADPSVDSFRVLFMTEELPAPDTLRAMGLTMLHALIQRNESGQYRVMERLAYMADELDRWHYFRDSLAATLVQRERDEDFVDQQADRLGENVRSSAAFWAERVTNLDSNALQRQREAFSYLENLTANYVVKGDTLRGAPRFAVQLNYLGRVDSLYRDYLAALEADFLPYIDPINEAVPPPPSFSNRLQPAWAKFEALERTYLNFREGAAATDLRTYRNAFDLKQVLDVGAGMLFFLTEPKQDTFASAKRLASLLIEPKNRQKFQGLIYQRLAQQPTFGSTLSARGLADLSIDMSLALENLMRPGPEDTLQLKRYLDFLVTTVNTVLEAPLIQTMDNRLIRLVDQRKELRALPTINRSISEIYGHTAAGEYRQAVVPLLELVEQMNVVPDSTSRMRKLRVNLATTVEKQRVTRQQLAELKAIESPTTQQQEQLDRLALQLAQLQNKESRDSARLKRASQASLTRFRRYTSFGAALAAANQSREVQEALDAFAVPVGSSRNKRIYRFNVDLNAYFGGAVGREFLINEPPGIEGAANTFGMWVPVGASVTWRPWPRRQWSATLFIPILDLGAITAYRSGNNAGTVPAVTFQNLLAPGAHALINIPDSPFFVGAGLQYGPNERQIGREDFSAYRALITFGIDVPILSIKRSQD